MARRPAVGRARGRAAGLAFAGLVSTALVIVALAVREAGETPRRVEERPTSEEDVVVEQWWRQESPAAIVRGCRNTGVADPLVAGEVWICRLWYLRPSEARTVCVSLGEHVVYRRVRAGDLPGRAIARCE